MSREKKGKGREKRREGRKRREREERENKDYSTKTCMIVTVIMCIHYLFILKYGCLSANGYPSFLSLSGI